MNSKRQMGKKTLLFSQINCFGKGEIPEKKRIIKTVKRKKSTIKSIGIFK